MADADALSTDLEPPFAPDPAPTARPHEGAVPKHAHWSAGRT